MSHSESQGHIVPYKIFTLVYLGLLVLTVLTVWVKYLHLGPYGLITALAIATAKCTLVVLFFMHVKYENWTIKLMLITALVILAIFIGFTFFDVYYR